MEETITYRTRSKIVRGFYVILMVTVSIPVAFASQIPIGLDRRQGIFLQEYWHQGVPSYCIANTREETVTLVIERRVGFDKPALLLAETTIDAHTVELIDAQAFLEERYLSFRIKGGPKLGLLRGPGQNKPSQDNPLAVLSSSSLNGSRQAGGGWLEQSKITFKSGEPMVLKLMLRNHRGIVRLDHDPDDSSLPILKPVTVSATSLRVIQTKEGVEINTDQPLIEKDYHEVELHCTAPIVTTPTLVQLFIRLQLSPQNPRYFIRGLLISP